MFAVFLGVGSQVDAQVDCGNPDNLCTGDPCVIPSLEVALPCVVDFGPRTVVVAGRLRTPMGTPVGGFSLSAGTIEVPGTINARNAPGVTLTAAQDIVVTGRIGKTRVTMIAGGDITHEGRIFVTGAILDAGGTLRGMGRIRGGHILRGVAGVRLLGGSVKLPFNGSVEISSDAGEVTVDVPVQGLEVVIEAAGPVVLSKRIIGVELFEVSSASGDITISGPVHIYPGFAGLTALIAAAGTVRLDHKLPATRRHGRRPHARRPLQGHRPPGRDGGDRGDGVGQRDRLR